MSIIPGSVITRRGFMKEKSEVKEKKKERGINANLENE